MEEPGIDLHEWASQWESLEDDVRDAPADALSDLDELVARMMAARGLATVERDGEDAPEHEATREFVNARAITRQVAGGDDVDPGDVAYAVNAYRELYEELLSFGADRGDPA
jgi:hypothetical protein